MSDALYIKQSDKANADKAITKVAYHLQEARKHLNALSTQEIANEIGITKQGLQLRINVYKDKEAKRG